MTWLKTLLFTAIVPGTVTIYLPRWLLASEQFQPSFDLGLARYLSVVLIILGAAIYGWCAWDFTFTGKGTPAPIDPPKELVVRGLYRYTRNPMYVGVLTVLLGEVLWFGSRRLLVYTAAVALLFQLFITFYEEPVLVRQFGDVYRRYCAAVPRWFFPPPRRGWQ
jgi:protein-S-isoprenylcysteine O-methyltransferase Ste14